MGYKLLIVDDSLSMRLIIKKMVEMSDFEAELFLQAGSGQEALKVLAENQVDLVLSDINMPEMSGIELLAKIKGDPSLSAIPVIMISTEGSEERQKEARELGASGYLQKPFQPEEVGTVLEEVIGGSG
jgi:two-component system chemotaxis response regulator CheY